jgi:hypothetical protein
LGLNEEKNMTKGVKSAVDFSNSKKANQKPKAELTPFALPIQFQLAVPPRLGIRSVWNEYMFDTKNIVERRAQKWFASLMSL